MGAVLTRSAIGLRSSPATEPHPPVADRFGLPVSRKRVNGYEREPERAEAPAILPRHQQHPAKLANRFVELHERPVADDLDDDTLLDSRVLLAGPALGPDADGAAFRREPEHATDALDQPDGHLGRLGGLLARFLGSRLGDERRLEALLDRVPGHDALLDVATRGKLELDVQQGALEDRTQAAGPGLALQGAVGDRAERI